MNVLALIVDEKFLKKDQFQKTKILEKYLLKEEYCKIGNAVICFENEIMVSSKSYSFYKQYGAKHISTLTIGKQYKILDYKEDKIKIENDHGNKLWYTIDRFVYSLQLERKEKLKKLENYVSNK